MSGPLPLALPLGGYGCTSGSLEAPSASAGALEEARELPLESYVFPGPGCTAALPCTRPRLLSLALHALLKASLASS